MYTGIALVLFTVGLILSLISMELGWRDLWWSWIAANILAGAPAAIALNAVSLKISAKIVDTTVAFPTAFQTCCVGICSNLLPVPAGSLIHTSALITRGAPALQSGLIVLMGNLLSLAMVMLLSGLVLTLGKIPAGPPVLAVGSVLVLASAAFLITKVSLRLATSFLLIRLARIAVMIVRIQVSFIIIGVAVTVIDAALFSGAVILGKTLAVFPAGFGISEALAALLAMATTISPGAAFVAIGLNRISTLTFAGLFVLAIQIYQSADKQHE